MIKNPPAMRETWVQSLDWEDPPEKGVAAYSSILVWRIPWTEDPGRLQSMGLLRVGHDWMTLWNARFILAMINQMKVKVAQSCLTLWDPMDCIVHGLLQARILEWVAFPFSRGSSQPRDWIQISHIAGRFFTSWATRMINQGSILKSKRHWFTDRSSYSQNYGFSSSHVQIRELDHKEGWVPKIDAFGLWCWWRLWRVPWTVQRSNQSILKEINPECSLEGLRLKLKLQYFGHLMLRASSLENTLMLVKTEGKRRSEGHRIRWLDS